MISTFICFKARNMFLVVYAARTYSINFYAYTTSIAVNRAENYGSNEVCNSF